MGVGFFSFRCSYVSTFAGRKSLNVRFSSLGLHAEPEAVKLGTTLATPPSTRLIGASSRIRYGSMSAVPSQTSVDDTRCVYACGLWSFNRTRMRCCPRHYQQRPVTGCLPTKRKTWISTGAGWSRVCPGDLREHLQEMLGTWPTRLRRSYLALDCACLPTDSRRDRTANTPR